MLTLDRPKKTSALSQSQRGKSYTRTLREENQDPRPCVSPDLRAAQADCVIHLSLHGSDSGYRGTSRRVEQRQQSGLNLSLGLSNTVC